MCVVSNIGDQIGTNPYPWDIHPPIEKSIVWPYKIQAMQEWLLKIDKILIAAKAFDIATGQPDCEIDEKMAALKELAEQFDVDMEFFNE